MESVTGRGNSGVKEYSGAEYSRGGTSWEPEWISGCSPHPETEDPAVIRDPTAKMLKFGALVCSLRAVTVGSTQQDVSVAEKQGKKALGEGRDVYKHQTQWQGK